MLNTFIDFSPFTRIQESHIPELNKELLKDLGISVIEDVISILKFSSTPAEPKVNINCKMGPGSL